ncbi:PKD domain-containing protein [Planosporangium thailandense]|uniref:PKD domain-containing protein n=2 Tax=Planosporangium thailandense TaxID=765197 RepID=A0ABX0XSN1_9ACTN|nr:FG-GAP-like repeat-containing protein [Planosporangium thailandense]NJC69016.1 PKD domain-containing protein [Planosporangium thailandense]
MRKHPITGPAVVVLAASAALVAGAGPAVADASAPLYVNNSIGSNCSNSGAGTQARPYCTISAAIAAVQPGQTINITSGTTYDEHVTINKSGTAGNPIALSGGLLSGANAGITIDGQHDISIVNVAVSNPQNGPGVAVSNSSRITLQGIDVNASFSGPPIVGVQLTAVTNSSLINVGSSGVSVSTGIALDAATTGVLVKTGFAVASQTGIDVAGSNNRIIDSSVQGGATGGIVLEPGAANNVVADNMVHHGRGTGIRNTGATGTAITNNTVSNNCGTGIRVDGASSGVSVQNNLSSENPAGWCGAQSTDVVEIGVYDAAVSHTVVNYNTVYVGTQGNYQPYAWGTPMGLAAFRTASHQAVRDIQATLPTGDTNDNANSAAPGFQPTDIHGHVYADGPAPNTGAGPISYADRGAEEYLWPPTARLAVTVDRKTSTATADASASTVSTPTASYAFDFGDGSKVTQSTPIATHQYAKAGPYVVSVTVTDGNGQIGTENTHGPFCMPARVPSTPGASQLKADFDGDRRDDVALFYDYGGGHVALFTLTSQGCDEGFDPALRRWDAPHWGGGTKFVTTGDFNGDGKSDVALFYDYGNGHVAVFTLTAHANGDGGFSGPVLRTDLPYLGGGTKFMTAGDFNGDGKADLGLFYDYGDGHVALFTLLASGGGGFAGPTLRVNYPHWGGGTKFMTAGDFNGDGKADLGLFYDYGDGHVALFTLLASGGGGFTAPTLGWNAPHWGSGTRLITTGNFNGDGKADIALFYDYGSHVSLFTLAATTGNGSFGGLTRVWDDYTKWGHVIRFLFAGSFTGVGRDTIGLFLDSGGEVDLDTMTPVAGNGYDPPNYRWYALHWGTGTRAVL